MSLFIANTFTQCALENMVKKIRIKIYFILPIIFLIAGYLAQRYLVINVTNSMPRGIYLKQYGVVKRNDIVLICLDSKNQQFGLSRHYILPGIVCGKSAPLIKEVLAIPRDSVSFTNRGLIVNKKLYPLNISSFDSENRKLPIFPYGQYQLDGYWVVGSHASNSWDSRYWGPIQDKQIISKLTPLFTWE